MEPEELANQLQKFFAPFLLVASPLFLILAGRELIKELAAGNPLPEIWVLFVVFGFGVAGMAYGFWYCKFKLGWFERKKR